MSLKRLSPWPIAALTLLLWAHGTPTALALETSLNWSRSDPQPDQLEAPTPSPFLPAPLKRTIPEVAAVSASTLPLEMLIDSITAQLQLDARLVHAMIDVESRYNPDALSSKGAVGLMQVMPATAKRFGFTDLRDPATNVRAGATYLKWLLEHFDHDLELAIAGYNAGEGAVKKYGRSIPPYPETQHYVSQVMQRYRDGPKTGTVVRGRAPGVTPPSTTSGQPLQNLRLPLNRLFEVLLSAPSAPAGER